jgi:hypothetical protein
MPRHFLRYWPNRMAAPSPTCRRPPLAARSRPRLETLEDRCLVSVVGKRVRQLNRLDAHGSQKIPNLRARVGPRRLRRVRRAFRSGQ